MRSLREVVLILAAATQIALAWPQRPQYAKVLENRQDVQDEYDYIIIGGGTSGLTVGDRLTENGKCPWRSVKNRTLANS